MKLGNYVLAIVGPTAVGKTSLAIELAQSLGTEIISADSRQIYRGMDIGTAKPSRSDQARVVHHLVDCVDPDQEFSAGKFIRLARPIITRLHQERKIPIVAGGTGLYIRWLLRGLFDGPEANWETRARLREREAQFGSGFLHDYLSTIDPESAGRIHPQDLIKVIRAIEVYEETGLTLSSFRSTPSFTNHPYTAIMIGIRRQRSDLYQRIDARIDQMLSEGLAEEVRGLMARGYSKEQKSMMSLGYRHMIEYLSGIVGYSAAVQRFKRDTRRYAKRQMTWFNREPSLRWIDIEPSVDSIERLDQLRSIIDSVAGGPLTSCCPEENLTHHG